MNKEIIYFNKLGNSNLSPNSNQSPNNGYFQFSLVAQSCPTLCDHTDRSTPGLSVHHQLLEFTQTHVYWVSDAIQPSHPLSSPSPLSFNLSQHQVLFKWISCSHQVAKVVTLGINNDIVPGKLCKIFIFYIFQKFSLHWVLLLRAGFL